MMIKQFYAIIDLQARAKTERFISSNIGSVYRYNQVVELTEYTDGPKIRWHNIPGSPRFFEIPSGCYKVLTREEHPECYL